MAVGTGAGALNATKPVTNNDLMEAIQLPGLKPHNGSTLYDVSSAVSQTEICTVGGAGYTEVIDDIIVEIVTAIAGSGSVDFVFSITGEGSHLVEAGAGKFRVDAAAGTAGKIFSVLRGNLPNSTSWKTTAETEVLRTYGPSSTVSDQTGVTGVTFESGKDGTVTAGTCRVWIRSHYTDVNFGSGL